MLAITFLVYGGLGRREWVPFRGAPHEDTKRERPQLVNIDDMTKRVSAARARAFPGSPTTPWILKPDLNAPECRCPADSRIAAFRLRHRDRQRNWHVEVYERFEG